jgi:hypothetical protein
LYAVYPDSLKIRKNILLGTCPELAWNEKKIF